MSEETIDRVFVYGTLLEGERNHYLLETSEKMGREVVSGFRMVNLGSFPACAEEDENPIPVIGEVYRITPITLARLDHLEGYPQFYNRKLVDTFDGPAWIYFCNSAEGSVINSGSWRNR